MDSEQHRLSSYLTVTYCLFVAALVTTLLRLYTRGVVLRQFSLDDYFIILAMLLGITFQVMYKLFVDAISRVLARTAQGNRHGADVEASTALKWTFFSSIVYTFHIWAIKTSILLFFRRFIPSGPYRKAAYGMIILNTMFTIAIVIATIFQCKPVSTVWNIFVRTPTSCSVQEPVLQIVTSGINLATDLLILVLPFPTVFLLQLERRKKWGLALVFLVAGAGCVATAVRLASSVQANQAIGLLQHGWPEWLTVVAKAIMWSLVEVYLITLCANLPALAALFRKRGWQMTSRSRSRPSKLRTATFDYELSDNDPKQRAVSISAVGRHHTVNSSEEHIIPLHRDIVRSTRVMVSVEPAPAPVQAHDQDETRRGERPDEKTFPG
ncbi:MAG: hypothetical protein M1826_007037 [Phylliscum demangeonii]|nr:MAG: hypothetical protein M1826_007037 [Phylliscum demangeonii]